jgi:4-carboxymuconolactone decarboxylase
MDGRLPILEPNELTPSQSQLYERIDHTLVPWAERAGFIAKRQNGTLVGPFNPFLFSSEISEAFLNLVAAEWSHTTLDKRVREVVILTVGAVWISQYELYAHAAVAKTVGLSDDAIRSLVTGAPPRDLTTSELSAHTFARQLCTEYKVDAGVYREAEASFGQNGLLNLIYLVGLYQFTCAVLNGFEIPVPEPEKRDK